MNKSKISLSKGISTLFKHKWIIVASVIVLLVATMLFDLLMSPIYQTSELLNIEYLLDDQDEQNHFTSLISLLKP